MFAPDLMMLLNIVFSVQLQSVIALRRTLGPSSKWPVLGYNKWDTSRSAGKLCLNGWSL